MIARRTLISICGMVLALGIFLYGAALTHAQITADDIFFEAEPTYPEPNEDVEMRINSFLIDTNAHVITWYVNDQIALQGIGENTFVANSGPVGTVKRIRVVINFGGGFSVTKSAVLSPIATDILWEAHQGYTPPFYKGRTLPVAESTIKLVGIPDPSVQNDAIFEWSENFDRQRDDSGYQKDSFMFYKNLVDNKFVRLIVRGRESGAVGQRVIPEVPAFNPQLRFYERVVEDGITVSRPIESPYIAPDGEFTLSIEPFYFTEDPENLTYRWQINGNDIDNDSNVIRLNPTTPGRARLEVFVENEDTILQGFEAELIMII